MIVDCHTHVWQSPDQLGQLDLGTCLVLEFLDLGAGPSDDVGAGGVRDGDLDGDLQAA